MELADIKQCRVCHGYNLFKSTLLLQDIISDKYKLTDVILCSDCDTIHYIKDDSIFYEFNINVVYGDTNKPIVQIVKDTNGI